MHDTVFMIGRQRWSTSRTACGKLHTTSRMPACGMGWAARRLSGRPDDLGNAAAAAIQLLPHSSVMRSVPTPPPPRLCCTQWDDRQNSHITLSTVERKKGLNIGYSRAATCAFFTNFARWKFSYKNRLVEISRESCDNLTYERCPK